MNEREQGIIKLLEKHVADMDNEFDTLDRKAQQSIAVSSIITAAVGAFRLNEMLPLQLDDLILLIMFAVYAVIFALSFWVLYPKRWLRTPLEPTIENVNKVVTKDDEQYHQWLIDSYLSILRDNTPVLKHKTKGVVLGIFLIAVEIGVIVIAIIRSHSI